jgi:hypothetical protein
VLIERSVLAAVHGLLADEPGDLALQYRIGELVTKVTDGPDEVVLPVREERRQDGGEVAQDEVAVQREVLRDVTERLLEGDPPGRHVSIRMAVRDSHLILRERQLVNPLLLPFPSGPGKDESPTKRGRMLA